MPTKGLVGCGLRGGLSFSHHEVLQTIALRPRTQKAAVTIDQRRHLAQESHAE